MRVSRLPGGESQAHKRRLPQSDTPSRIKSNADVFSFSLSEKQMASLDKLGEGKDQPICPFNVNCP